MQGQPEPTDPDLSSSASELRAALLDWYDAARRQLPWRAAPGKRADPWQVLVSELMLQQTTVATVRARYAPFLARFPTLDALARSSLDEVLHAWQGLGYYRRARALHACALAVVERHAGRLPLEADRLAELPGIGPYTAAAVAAIAGGRAEVPVDANVERVLARMTALERPVEAARPLLRRVAAGLAAPARAADFAQAVMELGALVCTPRRPGCLTCPWRGWCRAAASGDPERYPPRSERKGRAVRFATAYVLERADGAVLFRRRPETGLLAGLIELPGTEWSGEPWRTGQPAGLPEMRELAALPGEVRHLFTHIDLTVTVLRGKAGHGGGEGIWTPPERFDELALPTLTRKLLRHAGLAG
ncbi:MAG: A/G-specific adenine glycosylase [Geminicoccaceae bacterium]